MLSASQTAMKSVCFSFALAALCCCISQRARSQGFQDLDFNSAQIGLPTGYFNAPFNAAFPGWSGYIGTDQTATASVNVLTLGSCNICLGGSYITNDGFGGHGSYSLVLQSGNTPA